MKKYSILSVAGILATCGVVFAGWSFTNQTTLTTTTDQAAVTIDTTVASAGNHGTLVVTAPDSLPEITIKQNAAHNSAAFYNGDTVYTTEDVFSVTYTPAEDEDEPEVYSLYVNYTITIEDVMTSAGMSVVGGTGTLVISQAHLTETLAVNTVMDAVKFPEISNYASAKTFVNAIKDETCKINVAFEMVATPADQELDASGYGYRTNNGQLLKMDAHNDKEYKFVGVKFNAGDLITFKYNSLEAKDFAPEIKDVCDAEKFERVEIGGKHYIRIKVAGTYSGYLEKGSEGKLYIA